MPNKRPRIVNIVATGQFPCEIDIEEAYCRLNCKEKIYEPDIYPALLVKVGEKRRHVTLYANGKYIICGVRSKRELIKIYEEIRSKLEACGLLKTK